MGSNWPHHSEEAQYIQNNGRDDHDAIIAVCDVIQTPEVCMTIAASSSFDDFPERKP